MARNKRKKRRPAGGRAVKVGRQAESAAAVKETSHRNQNRLITPAAPSNPAWLFWLLVAFVATPSIVGPYGQEHGYTPDLHMAAYIQVVGVALLSLYAFSRLFYRRIEIPRAPVVLPLGLFYLWAMLSILWTHNKYEAVVDGLDWTGAFIGGLLVLFLARTMKQATVILFVIAVSGFLMALLGIGQFLFGIDWVQQHIVPAATFSNKNMAGQYGLLTLPLALGFFFYSKSRLGIWFFAIASALIVAYIFYTRTRAGWLSGGIELIAMTLFVLYGRFVRGHRFFGSTEKKTALIAACAVVMGMTYLTPKMLGNEAAVEKASIGTSGGSVYHAASGYKLAKGVTAGAAGSANTRLTMWMNSIPMFLDNPWLGVGLGNWTIHYATYQSWYKQDHKYLINQFHANAHNDYVEMICEFGIVGVILMLWLLAGLIRTIKPLLFAEKKPDEEPDGEERLDTGDRALVLGVVVALIGIGVDAVFSFPLKQPVPSFLVMIYMAILSQVYAVRFSRRLSFGISSTVYAWSSGIVLAVMTTAVTVLQYRWYHSELGFRKSVLAMRQDNQERLAMRASQDAYRHNPLRKKLLWNQAVVLLSRNSFDKALPLLEQMLAAYPANRNTLLNISAAYSSKQRYREAAYYLKEMFKIRHAPSLDYDVAIKYVQILNHQGWHNTALDFITTLEAHLALASYHRGIRLVKRRMNRGEPLEPPFEEREYRTLRARIIHLEKLKQYTLNLIAEAAKV